MVRDCNHSAYNAAANNANVDMALAGNSFRRDIQISLEMLYMRVQSLSMRLVAPGVRAF
jgi:hypothetical protein